MSDASFSYEDLWYIKLAGYDSKFPSGEWGGYSQSYVAADEVYRHNEVIEADHDHWGVVGTSDFDNASVSLLIFDLDIHKAPDEFDPDRVSVPDDTLIVKSQNGGFHVYFKVHGDRGELQESDFAMADDPGWDIDIRGSAVSMHVVAPTEVPGVDSPYQVVNDEKIKTVIDPADAAERIQLDGDPLLEFDPGRRIGEGVEIDRDVEPPEEMPACYHRGLQLRAENPDNHPNTHKVNVLTALCGLAAGYEVDTMVQHFCDEYPPGEGCDPQKTEYHLNHIARNVENGVYSPPAPSTLRDYGILGDDESCDCSIPYHGSDDSVDITAGTEARRDRAAEAAAVAGEDGATADGGTAVSAPSPDSDLGAPEEPRERAGWRIHDEVLIPYDPPEDYEGETIDKQTAVHRTAEIYHDELAWLRPRSDTRGWRTCLHNYVPEEGIYEPHGEAEIERLIDAHLGAIVDNQFTKEVVGKVERMARIRAKRLSEDPEWLVVENGILNLETGELREHSSAEFHQTRLDIPYDEDAECDEIDEFLHEIVDDGDVDKLYRFIAHALYRDYPEEKAAMLLGSGENGKSMFLELVEEFLGEFNVSNQSLQKLNEKDWAPARLQGKLANVVPDMGDQSPDSMQVFKALTGNDYVQGDVKYEKPVKFKNHATLMFACNEMPVLHDDTRGNWRRWQLIDFPYTFDESDPDAKDPVPKTDLRERLFSDEELAGLLNRCVEEIQRWAETGEWFPDADSPEETRNKMRRAAEPVYDFAHACLRPVEDSDHWIAKDTLRKVYKRYAEDKGLKKMGGEEFGERLLNLTDFRIESCRPRGDNGERVNAYQGVELTSRGQQLLQDGPDGAETGQVGLDAASDATGPNGDIQRLKETLRDHGGESDEDQLFVSCAEDWGMDREQFEHALEKAKNRGQVMEPTDGLIRTT